MPPTKPVKRCPHTGSRTFVRDAATSAWPEEALSRPPMRDGEPYTSPAAAGRAIENVTKGVAAADTARKALQAK